MQQLTCLGARQIEWREVPEPTLESDQAALVRPLAVARCDIDLLLGTGLLPSTQPFALGHECVAEIVALGDAVRGLAIGQRVVVSFQLSCGTCCSCTAGHSANCDAYPLLSDYGMQPLSGVEYGGMLADLVRVPFANAMLQPISDAQDPVALASVSDNVLDGYRAVAAHLAARPGSEVLIVSHGYPSIPLYAVQAALALGASAVDFASQDEAALEHAARLGARPLRSDFQQRERRYPIVVDGGFLPAGLQYAIACTENEGICQSLGFLAGETPLPLGKMYTRGVRLFVGRTHAAALLPEVVALIEAGKLNPAAITTRVVEREEAARAYLEPAHKLVVRMTRS
jgi:threonine dehydrogenase-like Zn-dependent dehydrogenase